MTNPHILITNDDGVDTLGILILAQHLREIGDVTVLAPDKNWSACGHARTLTKPLRIRKTRLSDNSRALTCDGTPADCVALACLGAVERPADIVVSGINRGMNLAQDVTCSGTVSAAFEGALNGIPSIAVSTQYASKMDYAPAAKVAVNIAKQVLANGLPNHTILNINVPIQQDGRHKGTKITTQGTRVYNDRLDTRQDPRGATYYWLAGDRPEAIDVPGSDTSAVLNGYVSVTPLQLNLVAQDMLTTLKDWSL